MRITGGGGARLFLQFYLLSASAFRLTAAPRVGAVPISSKNCGKASDLLAVGELDASVWPPTTAAPLVVNATFDQATGQLTNLAVFLLFGPEWTFESGSLPTSLKSGFVSLPGSVPLTVANPALPVPAGPYTIAHVFWSPDGSVTVKSVAALGAALSAPLTTLSLTFNGTPGFPVPAAAGTYEARVQMTLPSGAEVFCADFVLPNVSFVRVTTPRPAGRRPGWGRHVDP